MLKSFTLLLFLLLSLHARENPFFPSGKDVDIPITSNQNREIPPLKRATFTLPSSARVIESITIEYKNLDGSLSKKRELLQNSIDWHLPLFLSQSYSQIPQKAAPKSKKAVQYTKLLSLKFIKLLESKKELKILTKDKMLRSFLLTQPHRIVTDFSREIDMRSYMKKITAKGIIKRVRIGNHDGFYRVVIELDGYYAYQVNKIDEGYLFKFL